MAYFIINTPSDVIFKLLAFTLAMIVVPIGSYFATVNTVFRGKVFFSPILFFLHIPPPPKKVLTTYKPLSGNSTFAGATAAIMANVVLIAYVIVAMREDQSEQHDLKRKEGKKDR